MPRTTHTNRSTDGKPNLVILHRHGSLLQYPFDNPKYRRSYFDFFKLAERAFAVYYVRGKAHYRGQGAFSRGWRFMRGQLVPHQKTIRAKIIYNKGRLHANGGSTWSIVNRWNLYAVTYDKYRSYRLFRQYMKPTFRVRTKAECIRALKRITTSRAVFKPVFGAEGRGIIIAPKHLLIKRLKRYDGLLQTFIDTAAGVPGICRGYHDMRILMMNGRIVQSYIRSPRSGSLLANVAQGGHLREIPIARIPRAARAIAGAVDRVCKKFGARAYAVDFGFEKGVPYLFEINPQPGLPYPEWKRYYRSWHRALLQTLQSSI